MFKSLKKRVARSRYESANQKYHDGVSQLLRGIEAGTVTRSQYDDIHQKLFTQKERLYEVWQQADRDAWRPTKVQSLLPAFRLVKMDKENQNDQWHTATSYLGGLPQMERGWPRVKDVYASDFGLMQHVACREMVEHQKIMIQHLSGEEPLHFVGQIDLSDLKEVSKNSALPAIGRLLFFVEMVSSETHQFGKVIYDSSEIADVVQLPEDLGRMYGDENWSFYTVADRTPRVHPGLNESVIGTILVPTCNTKSRVTQYTDSNIT